MILLKPNNEKTLRLLSKKGTATLHDVVDLIGEDAKNTIRSLHQCGHIQVVAVVKQKSKGGEMKDMNVYGITDSGKAKLDRVAVPKTPTTRPAQQPRKQDLHLMQTFIIPERDPNVNVMIASIGGRDVTITYGVHHPYEVYRPAPDNSRNYTPRPIRGYWHERST